jgi:hypothetical protein
MKKLKHNLIRDHSPPYLKIKNRIILKLKLMKTIKLFIITTLFSFFTSNSQITKGNWMVGGDGSFSNRTEKSNVSNEKYKSSILNLDANVGYFFIDKLSGGLIIRYNKYSIPYADSQSSNLFSTGPFAKYYFLKNEKRINVFFESSYLHKIVFYGGENTNKTITNIFNLSGGVVCFFNSSVGLEFRIERSNQVFKDSNGYTVNDLIIGLGFQIHLEK